MLDQIKAAFERKDYSTAEKLIKQLLKESPDNPWGQLYLGRLQEIYRQGDEAEKTYRLLLRLTTNAKVITLARQGLQRIEAAKKEEKEKAIAQAIIEPDNHKPGILVLEPINHESRIAAAANFAKIMHIDIYTAKMILPSRTWRVYRTGKIGELTFYGKQLQAAGIPCLWLKVSEIEQIEVFQVKHLYLLAPSQVQVVCYNQEHQIGSLTFDLSEITAKVMGLLPIFEEVVDINAKGKLERKTSTQDYAQFCDLHLSKRRSILRMYDYGYDFQKSSEITPQSSQNTIKINWNNLMNWVNDKLPKITTWSDFKPFSQTVIDKTEILNQITPHIELYRKEKSNWDTTFHLYSGIVFNKNICQDP